MAKDEFTPEYDRLVSQYEKLVAKRAVIQREDNENRVKRISLFTHM